MIGKLHLVFLSRRPISAVLVLLFAISIGTITPASQGTTMHHEMMPQHGASDMMPCDDRMEMPSDCDCPHGSGAHKCDQQCAALCAANMTMYVNFTAQMQGTHAAFPLFSASIFKRGLTPHGDPPPPKPFS